MAIKVSRTHGLRVLYEKCGCTATREYEDAQMTKAVGETASYNPCEKHKQDSAKESAETISEILFEMLETAALQAQRMPTAPTPRTDNPSLGHAVEDVAAAQAAGGASATRTPIPRRPGQQIRTGGPRSAGVTRAGGTGLSPVSQAVRESRAAGGGASIDAELARSPEPQGGPRLGATSRQAVQEAVEEARESGEEVTALDVLLGVNDPSGV